MKKIVLFACLFLVGVVAKSQSITTGLIASYSFDDSTAKDVSGNGHHCVTHGKPTPKAGIKGASFYFHGAPADYFATPSTADLNLGSGNEWSISLWYYKESTTKAPTVLEPMVCKGKDASATVDYIIFLENGKFVWGNGASNDTAAWMRISEPSKLKWHHMVVTFKKTKKGTSSTNYYAKNIYQDNVLIKTDTAYIKASSNSKDSLFLGHYYDGNHGNDYYNGYLDEIRIYNRVLTLGNIDSLNKLKYTGIEKLNDVSSFKVYPNPTNKECNISFELKESTKIMATLYDMNGKLIYELANETYPVGQTSISLNYPSMINPGNYVLRIVAGNQVLHKNIIVVK
ncbi:MAG: T9SS type A sorting domain-containing protein [Bacteroidetes bacterium]|nr:T9SS type A sorting domain-containing protein [Bacteroidota bacterium]